MVIAFEGEKERTIVTSALPYIHGVPHLGNIAGSILPAEIFHRYLDILGEKNIYICGSDEHGTPTALQAIKEGVSPGEISEKNHEKTRSVLQRLNIDFTFYGRTSSEFNKKQTTEMFKKLYRNGYIIEKEQELAYCENDERFLPDRYVEGTCPHCGGLARGDQCDDCGALLEAKDIIEPYCKICGEKKITFKKSKNLYLKLSEFEDVIRDFLEDDRLPEKTKNEMLNLVNDGLEDRCITRDMEWGFEIPWKELGLDEEYSNKVFYVWFDAPIGYIAFTREFFNKQGAEEEWEKYWKSKESKTIYSIGKDNSIFHAIIWPAILSGTGENYNLPDYIFVQQFLTAGETKFSKSREKGLSSEKALDLLPADYWRFYLSSVLPQKKDKTFTWKDFEKKINGELNDNLGNFVNRTLSLAEKSGEVPDPELRERDKKVLEKIQEKIKKYREDFRNHDLVSAFHKALEIPRIGNSYLGEQEPWNNQDTYEEVIYTCLCVVKATASVLYPFIPESSEKIYDMLNLDTPIVLSSDMDDLKLKKRHELGEKELLFEKIDSEGLKPSEE